ncbi:MAG: type II toxin-antitoxin system RelE/ParE family toxin [Betaproteobacteria bacterium]|nr:type II toxin-antitoxin system RelE/ParE family toxin [Betaproteobacteria bacterium]
MASAEYEEVVDYYLTIASPAIARNLASAVGAALQLVLEHPQIGARTYTRARKLALQGFPHDLIYRIESETLIILAVSGHSRRPGYWAGRR